MIACLEIELANKKVDESNKIKIIKDFDERFTKEVEKNLLYINKFLKLLISETEITLNQLDALYTKQVDILSYLVRDYSSHSSIYFRKYIDYMDDEVLLKERAKSYLWEQKNVY